MKREITGKVVKGLGGLYEVLCRNEDGAFVRYTCRAMGKLRRAGASGGSAVAEKEDKLLIGDTVTITQDTEMPDDLAISSIAERRNALIRPPLANLDVLLVVFAAATPAPAPETIDKLLAIAEYHRIEPVIVVTKCDLDRAEADRLVALYRGAGFPVFQTCVPTGEGVSPLAAYLETLLRGGKTAAFAGASGVGKSTLINAVLPGVCMQTGDLSRRIERGKHTTRRVEIFPIRENEPDAGYLCDTPGFSQLDFVRFDFFTLEDLESTFRDIAPYRGKCRYADCTHVGEGAEECAVSRAANEGKIAASRLDSYRTLYRILKEKKQYK